MRRVTETVKRTADRLRVLTFESASGTRQTLRTTDEHPFWTANHHEFRPASRLEPGDTFLSPDGHLQTLTGTASESHPAGVFVYNFTVDIAHTYFVSATKDDLPLLVHNSCSVRASEQQLQSKFKHAGDCGVSGNPNKANLATFEKAIHDHVHSPSTQHISGTYRGVPVEIHVDPTSGLAVSADKAGHFISGWKLSSQQLWHVLNGGKLGGG